MTTAELTKLTSRPNDLDPLQVRAWQRLGASGRTELGLQLRRQVRRWKEDALRAQHPDWAEDHLRRELARLYLRGSSRSF